MNVQTSAELLSANWDFVLFAAIIFGVLLVLRWSVPRGAPGAKLPRYTWILGSVFVVGIGIRLAL